MGDPKNMSSILLESGTNELEMVEFSMAGHFYGINVAKVREIIRYPESIVPVPDSHPSIIGVINLRGAIIPVVNLPAHLRMKNSADLKNTRVIVCEFNKFVVGFWVDAVSRIHRLSWEQLIAPSDVVSGTEGSVVATVKLDDRLVMILDFEKITATISPESGLRHTGTTHFQARDVAFDRSTKTIIVAEDSSFIRDMIIEYLEKAGYQAIATSNGKEALDVLNGFMEQKNFHMIQDHVQLVITDIEMPQVDGLHLIKTIKETGALKKLPCVVFSSMISEELAHKCRAVGAVAEITKPEIAGLVELVDEHVIK